MTGAIAGLAKWNYVYLLIVGTHLNNVTAVLSLIEAVKIGTINIPIVWYPTSICPSIEPSGLFMFSVTSIVLVSLIIIAYASKIKQERTFVPPKRSIM